MGAATLSTSGCLPGLNTGDAQTATGETINSPPPAVETEESESNGEPDPESKDRPKLLHGHLTSHDGLTTGEVFIKIVPLSGGLNASVKFVDLETPYEEFVIGGALEPRGDDPCFDTGLRSSTYTYNPKGDLPPGPLSAAWEDLFINEIILYIPSATPYEECLNKVIATAPLSPVEE